MKIAVERRWVSKAAVRSLSCWWTVTGESLAGGDKQQVHLLRAVCAWTFHCFKCHILAWMIEKCQASPFRCQKKLKQTSSHYDKTTNPLWINYWPLKGNEEETPGRQHCRNAAGLFGHFLALSLLAAQAGSSSSLLIDSEINGKSLCKQWDEITTPV